MSSHWSSEEIDQLKSAARKYADREKNDRWRKVGKKLGRSKRECYEKYKELKSDREESRSGSRPSSSSSKQETTASSKYSDHEKSSSSKTDNDHYNKTAETAASFSNNDRDRGAGGLNFFDDSGSEEEEDGFRIDWNAGSKENSKSSNGVSSNNSRTGGKSSSIICLERDPRVLNVASRISSKLITIDEAVAIRKLLFGGRRMDCFNKAWTDQGFFFNSLDGLKCGLVQLKGGPCGIIAVVQSHIMKHLLFTDPEFESELNGYDSGGNRSGNHNGSDKSSTWSNPTREQQENILLDAMTEILWRVAKASSNSRSPRAIVSIVGNRRIGRTSGYKPDGITETLSLYECSSMSTTRDFLDAHLKKFMDPTGHGIVLFTYSLILTSGLKHVKDDMDTMIDAPSLIGRHDYASQEMVNLMLCGHAYSNVFDGQRDMGGVILRGIPNRTNVGMLTLFEHYEHVEVGRNMKLPRYPIWVLCSESHYSVLFTNDTNEVTSDPLERKGGHSLSLYYYDELAKQEELYRLTVDMPEYNLGSSKEDDSKSHNYRDSDLTPPIDHVIRTKWKKATVDWNGSEPLL
jgi:hypothetical protein